VCSEGCEQRLICEQTLMGGPYPLWELQVDDGTLRWDYANPEHPWQARLFGVGQGQIRSLFPNLKAASPWLKLSCSEPAGCTKV